MPVRLNVSDYDDTEMVQVARDILNRTFSELPAHTLDWRRSAEELGRLSSSASRTQNARPPSEAITDREGMLRDTRKRCRKG